MAEVHIDYVITPRLRELLGTWDERIAAEGPVVHHRWTDLTVWSPARSATVAGSTGTEGNPLSAIEVDEVLSGGRVDARAADIRDVRNYNAALDLANRAALRSDFTWTQELIRRLNAAVLSGLEHDERGEYRQEAVTVGGMYSPPEHQRIPALMADVEKWLQQAPEEHALIRAGLVHLNLVAIHPWLDGNGRTARVAGSLMLMRHGVAAPELVNVESYIRAHRDEYVNVLQTTHGADYRPGQHSATPWLEYFSEVSLDRLELRNRLEAALRADLGFLFMEVDRLGQPGDWAPILLAARLAPVRTAYMARALDRSAVRVRAIVGEMVRAGWLEASGERRGRRYLASSRLQGLDLRTPAVLDRLRSGGPVED